MGTNVRWKFCLLLSYCGKNYQGMQRNPGTNTVEECLLKALRDSEMIPKEHYNQPKLMFFQRAARTDKSVSAIRQIVSLQLPESITSKLDDVNKHMPLNIRLMGAKRVIESFDAKNCCYGRTYTYLMPSFALRPLSDASGDESYRVNEKTLEYFNRTLEGYVGTHMFHNFTFGKDIKDLSSKRFIRHMDCSEPFFPSDQKEVEYIVIRIKGQSFIKHQIRKMIGLAVAIVKGYATEEHMKRSMEAGFMEVPTAPGLGLILEDVHFDWYNRTFGGNGFFDAIEWNDENEALEEFKSKHIYPVVVETERDEKSMLNWLSTLKMYT